MVFCLQLPEKMTRMGLWGQVEVHSFFVFFFDQGSVNREGQEEGT